MAISTSACHQRFATVLDDKERAAFASAAARRPWRAASHQKVQDVQSPDPVQHWRNVASRMASAFKCSDTESDLEFTPCDDESCAPAPDEAYRLRPAPRGARECLCYGEVLKMCGHYGWLATDAVIDHQDAHRNDGWIYVHRRDVTDGVELTTGDKVVFYLYVDEQGLGAEDCRLQGWASQAIAREAPSLPMNPSARVFVPGLNPAAVEFTPTSPSPLKLIPVCAPRFVQPVVQHQNAFAVNAAYFSDSDDSSDESVVEVKADGACDGDVSDGEAEVPRVLRARRALTRRTTRKKRASSHGSSSTKAPSDSDKSVGRVPVAPPPGLGLPAGFSPPPGLGAPQGFCPPPGLQHPFAN